jgi:hypothetical protein
MVNNKISKKGTFGTTMGVTSIIAILVILVLIVFAALAVTTSKADLKLSEKTAMMTTAYYEADSAAEAKFAEVAEAVKSGPGWQGSLGEGYTVTDEDGVAVVAYDVHIDGDRSLFVRLSVSDDGGVSRDLWQVRFVNEWNGNNDVQLMIE